MADNEPTLTVDDPTSDHAKQPPVAPEKAKLAPPANPVTTAGSAANATPASTVAANPANPVTTAGSAAKPAASATPAATVAAPVKTPRSETTAATGFAFDENTLGRSTSVFDAGVEFAPQVPPVAPPIMAAPPHAVEPAPERSMSAAERRRRVRLEARRVRRIVRHIEPWSVLKISILFYFCLWIIFVLAGVLLWSFAEDSGTLASVEELIESLFGLDEEGEFWSGGVIFRAYAMGTMVLFIAGVTFNVLLCVLYNLISDLTGGIRITVIEEESARFTPPKRRARR